MRVSRAPWAGKGGAACKSDICAFSRSQANAPQSSEREVG
jgi:hypothetical protein